MRIEAVLSLVALVFASPASGGQPSSLEPAGPFFQQDVAWSPDGKTLAFSQLRTDGEQYRAERWTVMTVASEGGKPEAVAAAARNVSWSPDGKRLAFACMYDGNWEICVSDRDGGARRRLTESTASEGAPAWSPDGGSLAYHSDRGGEGYKIHVMELAAGTERQLTSGEGADYGPCWSPDGESIVFYRERGDGADQIWTVTLAGEEQPVTRDERNNVFPAFRHDGRIIFASQAPGDESILVHTGPDGSDRAEVRSVATFFARYAPDGKRIAFIAGSWPRSAIYVTTTAQRRIKIVN